MAKAQERDNRQHRWPEQHPSRADDNSDDNPDDSCTPNNAHNCPKMVVSCLVTASARSWWCGGPGFESPLAPQQFEQPDGLLHISRKPILKKPHS
jgi:hypothetical protein